MAVPTAEVQNLPTVEASLPVPVTETTSREPFVSSESKFSGGIRDAFKHLTWLVQQDKQPSSVSSQSVPEARIVLRDKTTVGQMIKTMREQGDELGAKNLENAANGRYPTKPFTEAYGFTAENYRTYAKAAEDATPKTQKETGFKIFKVFIQNEAAAWDAYLYEDKEEIKRPREIEEKVATLASQIKRETDPEKRRADQMELDRLTADSSVDTLSLYFTIDSLLQRSGLTLQKYIEAKTRIWEGAMAEKDVDLVTKAEADVVVLREPIDKTVSILTGYYELPSERVATTNDEREAFSTMRELVARIAKAAGRDYSPRVNLTMREGEVRGRVKTVATDGLQPPITETTEPDFQSQYGVEPTKQVKLGEEKISAAQFEIKVREKVGTAWSEQQIVDFVKKELSRQ
jgi:hypothetical protein